ncbi:hypothetical protein Zm00014a_014576, partial [Zea mays]
RNYWITHQVQLLKLFSLT